MGDNMAKTSKHAPVHPGEILKSLFLEPLHMSQRSLADAIGVDSRRISDIVRGRRSITGDTALRLATYFGTSAEYWMNMQKHFELETAKSNLPEIKKRIQPISRQSSTQIA
jgi:addiction module HigA family antidote